MTNRITEGEQWRISENPPDGLNPFRFRLLGGEGRETRPIAMFMHLTDIENVIALEARATRAAAERDSMKAALDARIAIGNVVLEARVAAAEERLQVAVAGAERYKAALLQLLHADDVTFNPAGRWLSCGGYEPAFFVEGPLIEVMSELSQLDVTPAP